MKFDRWTLLFLERRGDAPHLTEPESDTLQDAHLAYLTKLHEEGHLLAAGPAQGPAGSQVAGICIYRGAPEEARRLAEDDPAVHAGVYRVELYSWQVPGGAMGFDPVRFPASMAEAGAK